jgi:hypothetical protein
VEHFSFNVKKHIMFYGRFCKSAPQSDSISALVKAWAAYGLCGFVPIDIFHLLELCKKRNIYRHCWGGPGASLPKFHWPQEGWDKLDHQKQFHVKHRKNYTVQVHSLCRISLGKCVENILHCEIYYKIM